MPDARRAGHVPQRPGALGIGRWNKVGLNRVTRRLAPWLPGFGVVVHRGRRYRTPVNVFPTEGGYHRFALTYGPDTDWVRNVLAAGGCQLETRGAVVRLVAPGCTTTSSGGASGPWNARSCACSAWPTS